MEDSFKILADTAEMVVLLARFGQADEEEVTEGEGGVPLGEALVVSGQHGAQAVFEQGPVDGGGHGSAVLDESGDSAFQCRDRLFRVCDAAPRRLGADQILSHGEQRATTL
ncbi:hypothetical protein [Streptomyces nigra]